jgi:signal transduction histidine kinase
VSLEVNYPPGQLEVLDAFADVLADAEAGTTTDAFYGRLCNVICRLASMDRAALFRYDEGQRRVRAMGAHGIDLALFENLKITVEDVPIARRALESDTVVEAAPPFSEDIPEPYASELPRGNLVCVPLSAAGRWIGVVLCDRAGGAALTHGQSHLLWTLGKTAALAAMARIATFQGERAHQLQQRIDIAREVHERVVQRLFGVSLALDADFDFPPEERKRAAEEIQLALTDLKSALERPLGHASRPTDTTLADEVQRAAANGDGMRVEVEADSSFELPAELEPLAQAVLAEALTNARKHAKPSFVRIRGGSHDGAFTLEVANDGAGRGHGRGTGMGLRLAAVEALQAGGFVEFGERGDGMWHVRLVVPVDG